MSGPALSASVYVRTPSGALSFLSPDGAAVLGQTDARGGFVDWLDAIHPDDASVVEGALARLKETGALDEIYRIRLPDGSVRWIHDRAFSVRDEGGPSCIVGVLGDPARERERRRAQRQSRSMEVLGRLTSGVAHDLANLMMGIAGGLRIVESRLDEQGPREILTRISHASERGSQLARRLLLYSRRPDTPALVPIDAALAELEPLLAQAAGGHVRVEVAAGAPGAIALVPPTRLDQVAVELAAEARDAMPQGGTLRIETEQLGDLIEIRFELRSAVGAPGAWANADRARAVAVDLDSELRIEGTVASLLLPQRTRAALGGDEARPPRRIVLLVDVDPLVRGVISAQLAELGQEVVEAESVEDAVAICADREIDLLLTEVLLPSATGPALAVRLRALRPEVRALFVSARSRAELIEAGTLDPDAPFLHKPFETSGLRSLLVGAADR